jgi:hypothetical protein
MVYIYVFYENMLNGKTCGMKKLVGKNLWKNLWKKTCGKKLVEKNLWKKPHYL